MFLLRPADTRFTEQIGRFTWCKRNPSASQEPKQLLSSRVPMLPSSSRGLGACFVGDADRNAEKPGTVSAVPLCPTCLMNKTRTAKLAGTNDVLRADARLEQSRERLDNLRAQIDSDVRAALRTWSSRPIR